MKIKLIKHRLLTTQSRQKSHADRRKREIEFKIRDRVSQGMPLKGVMRFEKKVKIRTRYVGPFEILDQIGAAAYRVVLPPELSNMNNVSYISMLRKYVLDLSHVLE